MPSRIRTAVAAAMGAAWFVVCSAALVSAAPPAYKPGEVIVRFRDSVTPNRRQAILQDLGSTNSKRLGRPTVERLRINKRTVDDAIARYQNDPDVVYIQPNYLLHALVTPNDSLFSQQWALQNLGQTGGTPGADIRATAAWSVSTGSPSVLVGIIDTGVDYDHPDLVANMWTNEAEAQGLPFIDDDGNGYVDDVRGWDFVNDDNDPMDDVGHGTHVAGTIGAVGNNTQGVAGVCWNVTLMPLKFLAPFGGTTADAVEAVRYATRMGVRLTSNSWGGGGPDPALYDAIAEARDAGILFVAAAGNSSTDTDVFPNYPSAYDLSNIVAVAATDHNDQLAGFSSFGATTVDLAAPGVDILSTLPSTLVGSEHVGNYGLYSGTSMATPHVSGVLALFFSRFPAAPGHSAKSAVLARVTPLPSLTGRVLTGGRLDALLPIADPDSTPPAPILDLRVDAVGGQFVALAWSASGDDGGFGTASAYDLRVATYPLDASNVDAAPRAPGPLSPLPSGGGERDTVRGLSFSTVHYFAVRAVDEFGNLGSLSNVVSATTAPPPDIDVQPPSISATLLTGQSAERPVTISNSGPSDLEFELRPRTAAAGASLKWRAFETSSRRVDDPAPEPPVAGPAAHYRPASAVGRPLAEFSRTRVTNLSAGGLRLGLLSSGAGLSTLRGQLLAFPDVEAADFIDVSSAVPALATLAAYDAVILSFDVAPADRNGLGNVLADYADGGGGVILTLASFINGWNVTGRLLNEGYLPFTIGFGPAGGSSLGTFDPAHPIMQGVTGAAGDLLGVVELTPGAQSVASWANNLPFVATQGTSVVGVNVFLADPGFWGGDVPLILHNAALWSGGGQWLSGEPKRGVVASGGSVVVTARLDATGLFGGPYDGTLEVRSNDPDEPVVGVAAHLDVIGAPDLSVEVPPQTFQSVKTFSIDGATTTHSIAVDADPSPGASLTLVADGDFGFPGETATLTVEGTMIGSVGVNGADCTPVTGSFPVTVEQLTAWLADGRLDAVVQNSIDVNTFCSVSRHVVTLSLPRSTNPLGFGSVFVGNTRSIDVAVRNDGTQDLIVSAVTTNRPEFHLSFTSGAVPPRTTQTLRVTFQPTAPGPVTATLHLLSDDADTPDFTLALAGNGILPPDVAVDPTAFAVTLPEGSTTNRTLHLSNVGASDLTFAIDVLAAAGLPESTAFAGLPAGSASATSAEEPRFRVTSTVTQTLASSPTAITAVADDPVAGLIYGQQIGGNRYFRYVAAGDRWEELAPSVTYAGSPGASTLLNGRVYESFAYQGGLGVYDVATNTWARIDSLGYGTGLTSDGSRYLYLMQYDLLFRFDPATAELSQLARAPFAFNNVCGLRHFEGRLYGFAGGGDARMAVYDVSSDTWRTLTTAPFGPLVGATIDPIRRSLVVSGPFGGNTVGNLSLDDERWTVGTLPLFNLGYGGIGWLSGPVPGVLIAQGDLGSGFARIVDRPDFVTVAPASGRVAAGATLDVDVAFATGGLLGGTYHAILAMATNDPDEAEVSIPVAFTVIGTPNLALAGETISVSSVQSFVSSGATTFHALSLPVVPGGSGVLALDYDGDFGDGSETALVTVEGVGLGIAPALGTDCSSGHVEFPVTVADLEAWRADGVVNVSVVNSPTVDAFCAANQHRVTLLYPGAADSVGFGEVFLGTVAERVLEVSNLGSAPLVIGSLVTDRPEFTVSSSSLTVPARTSVSLALRFAPVVTAALSATLTVTSNDPDQPIVTLPLFGDGVAPPVASIDPTAFVESLGEGETVQRALILSNTGGATLTFDVQLFVAPPDADSLGFSGLSRDSVGASNNPPPAYSGAAAEGASSVSEPRFHAASGEVLRRASSPVPLTCVVADEDHGLIYAQENQGTRFYVYDAAADRWDPRATSPIYSGNNGGAALLRGKVYTSYTEIGLLGVYSIDTNSWTTMPTPLPYGTGVMTSDDDRFLYMAVALTLARIDVETGAIRILPGPPIPIEPWGGMEYFEGSLYVHTGNGTTGFARYDVAAESWTLLPAVPGGAVLGSAIDPGTREYVTYGSYYGNNIYRYSIDHGTWGVTTLPLFSVFDGGMGYLTGAFPGVYMVEGEIGLGFAVLLGQPRFVQIDPLSGIVPSGDTRSLAVTLGDPQLRPGTYQSRFAIRTNDPLHPRFEVPVTIEIRTVPTILLTGAEVVLSSRQTFVSSGALTMHTLTPTEPVGQPAEFSLRADGDYADPGELATLTAEGIDIGTVGGVGADCVPAIGQFGVSDSLLASLIADGQITAQVQNSFAVDAFCPANEHTVTLTYHSGIDPVEFGPVFLGAAGTRSVVVHNVGTAPLQVERPELTGAVFASSTDSFTVAPGAEASIEVRFTPAGLGTAAGTMTVRSNDPRHPARVVDLRGEGVTPPEIAVTPAALHTRLGPELARDVSMSISNPGGQPLAWAIHRGSTPPVVGAALVSSVEASSRPARESLPREDTGTTTRTSEADAAPASSTAPTTETRSQAVPEHAPAPSLDAVTADPSLNDLIVGLGARYEEVTAAIPDRYDFLEGEIGSQIADGGNNMYDMGNRLYTNLGGPVTYANSVPRLSSAFGVGGRYFTRKFPGLFVLVADVRTIGEFIVDGNLGANGLGSVTGSVLLSSGADRQWIGFSKRVFGAGVPSVNHLIVVEDVPGLAHSYQTYTDSDYHGVFGLGTHQRLYYLLYAGRSGAPTTDGETQEIMERFLDIVDPTRRWLSASPSTGTVAPGQSQVVAVHFDSHGLAVGDYDGALVVESNAPAAPELSIAATLSVVSTPVIEVVPDSLDFPNAFVGFPTVRTLTVRSLGGSPLGVSGITTGNVDLTAAPASLTLAPGTSAPVDVTFTPTSLGTLAATVRVASNDPSTPQVPVVVTGSAVIPPQATIEPTTIDVLVSAGFRRRIPLRLCNTGGWPLTYSMMIDSTSWLSLQGPQSGELAAGGCADDTVTLDATALGIGIYLATLRVYSSDPDEREIDVDVRLRVVPAVGAILALDPDGINPGSNGRWVTTYLELSSPYQVEDIQIPTARAMGTVAADASVHSIGDNDDDGQPDLMLKFDRGAVVRLLPLLDRVEVVVTGELADGRGFVARDSARLVRPRVAWPNGGEALTSGATVILRWEVPSNWHVTRVEIDVSVDGGAQWEPLTVNATGTSLAWVVPGVNTVGGQVRLRLFDADGLLGIDVGDGTFAIVDAVSDAGPGPSDVVAMALWGGIPNPFLGSTRIRYALPVARRVRLEVFDLSGRRCRVLEDGEVAAGRHEVAWNGRDDSGRRLSAGVYVIRLQAGSEVMTRRVARIE